MNEGVAKGPEKKGATKITNVHDDGLSPSVMKALATESRRHRGKAFFSLLRVSVPLWFKAFLLFATASGGGNGRECRGLVGRTDKKGCSDS